MALMREEIGILPSGLAGDPQLFQFYNPLFQHPAQREGDVAPGYVHHRGHALLGHCHGNFHDVGVLFVVQKVDQYLLLDGYSRPVSSHCNTASMH